MRCLELFKGTGSISTYCRNNGIECVSLDWNPNSKADICCDIMEFDYRQFAPKYFDVIWASPECKIYSSMQNIWIRRKWGSLGELKEEQRKHDKFIIKTLEIIDYLQPEVYFIENPASSRIWEVEETKRDFYVRVDYCRFGFEYKKPTRILTIKKINNCLCECKSHKYRIGGSKLRKPHQIHVKSLEQRYSIPQKLIAYLFAPP